MTLNGLATLVVAVAGLVAAVATVFKDRGRQQRLKTNVELLKELPEGTGARTSLLLLIEAQIDDLLSVEMMRWHSEVRLRAQGLLFGSVAVLWLIRLTEVPDQLELSLYVMVAIGFLTGVAYGVLSITGPERWQKLFRMDRG